MPSGLVFIGLVAVLLGLLYLLEIRPKQQEQRRWMSFYSAVCNRIMPLVYQQAGQAAFGLRPPKANQTVDQHNNPQASWTFDQTVVELDGKRRQLRVRQLDAPSPHWVMDPGSVPSVADGMEAWCWRTAHTILCQARSAQDTPMPVRQPEPAPKKGAAATAARAPQSATGPERRAAPAAATAQPPAASSATKSGTGAQRDTEDPAQTAELRPGAGETERGEHVGSTS